jgi:hypothetical protein
MARSLRLGSRGFRFSGDRYHLQLLLFYLKNVNLERRHSMAINKAFVGHGIFTELSVTNAIDRYAGYVSSNPANPQPG